MWLFSRGVTGAFCFNQKRLNRKRLFRNFLKFQEQLFFGDVLGETIHIGHVEKVKRNESLQVRSFF